MSIKKHDRQGVRTPADVERKYNLQDQADLSVKINNAQKAAEKAGKDVDALNTALDQTELVNRLTKGGEAPALWLTEEGQLYIHARFINSDELAFGVDENGNPTLRLGTDTAKVLSWKDNEDGTFTLIGTDVVPDNVTESE